MRNHVITVSAVCVGLVTALFGTNFFLNYREMQTNELLSLWSAIALLLYCLGIYSTALLFQQLSRQESDIEPSFLVLAGVMGLLVGRLLIHLYLSLLTSILSPGVIIAIFPIGLFLSVLGIYTACKFKRRKSSRHILILLLRAIIPCAIAVPLMMVYNNGFPGVTASAEIRQQWAEKEFHRYTTIVNSFKICQPIIDRVGNIKFIAPYYGKNYLIYDLGSSGDDGELNLEIIGDKVVAIGNLPYNQFTDASSVKLTYQNKTEKLNCRNSK
ncbi:hypothetical protein NIES22_15020 [Calothrix brevissima NIES-22]|nr:hypothetical protein NIES22_15020 [Calothrix brevissima NIES-22]